MKNILLFAFAWLLLLAGVACSTDETQDTTIELECPKPYVDQMIRRDVSIKWTSVRKTSGYACRLICNNIEGEWEQLDKDADIYTRTKLDNGRYQFQMYATGNMSHTTDSQIRTIEFDIDYDPVLATPAPKIVLLNNTASASWNAVENAAGYAFRFDNDEWSQVGADILNAKSETLENGEHTFTIRAVGSKETDTEDSADAVETFVIDYMPGGDYTKGVFLRVIPEGASAPAEYADINAEITGDIYPLTAEEGTNRYSISMAGSKGFYTFIVDGKEYGWQPYSGNGCVGAINNDKSAVPYRSSPEYYAGYTVRESIGRLATKAESSDVSGLPLYLNLKSEHMIRFTVDRSYEDGAFRYSIALDENSANIVFAHYFDLNSWGGDWVGGNTIKGNRVPVDNNTPKLNNVDGTEAATDHSASYTNGGAAEDWTVMSDSYRRNRHFEGWEGDKVIEHPGYLRINANGYLYTPKFSTLTAPTTIVVEMDICRFSNAGPNTLAIDGDGTFKSCQYNKDGSDTAVDAAASGNRFTITEEMASPYNSGAAKTGPKKWSHLRFEIEGATANTRVGIVDVSKTSRICVDNVVVTKK